MNWPTEVNHEKINSKEKSISISNFSCWFNFDGGKLRYSSIITIQQTNKIRLMAMVNIDEKGVEQKFVAMQIVCAQSTQTAHAVWKMSISSAERNILSTKIFKVSQ